MGDKSHPISEQTRFSDDFPKESMCKPEVYENPNGRAS